MRQDLDCPDLPVVTSPVIWKGKKVQVVNEALKQAASEVQHCFALMPWTRMLLACKGMMRVYVLGTLPLLGSAKLVIAWVMQFP